MTEQESFLEDVVIRIDYGCNTTAISQQFVRKKSGRRKHAGKHGNMHLKFCSIEKAHCIWRCMQKQTLKAR